MLTKITKLLMVFVILFSFTSCEIIGGIFKAGLGVGIFLAIAVVVLIVYGITKISGK